MYGRERWWLLGGSPTAPNQVEKSDHFSNALCVRKTTAHTAANTIIVTTSALFLSISLWLHDPFRTLPLISLRTLRNHTPSLAPKK